MLRGFRSPSPASEAADVSRMLEPYYAAPPFTHSSTSTTVSSASPASSASPVSPPHWQPTAWVDAHGDVHDPDYRAFAPLPGRRRSYDDDADDAADSAHARFWKQQRRAAARRASMPLLSAPPPSMPPLARPASFRRPSVEAPDAWDDDPPYTLRNAELDALSEKDAPYVYTCTDALRLQLEALKLSVRLRIFRARRRWRERRAR